MKGVPRHPNPPPPPPPRIMKEGWSGRLYETDQSKQARNDWYRVIGRPNPVQYREIKTGYSYGIVRIAVVAIGVAFAFYMAYR